MAVVFLMIGAGVLVVGSLLALTFIDVAFNPQVATSGSASHATTWKPPMVRGGELLVWAAETAQRVARDVLSGPRDGSVAHKLGATLEEGVSVAADQSPQRDRWSEKQCDVSGRQQVGATAPELFELADQLRASHSNRELQKLEVQAYSFATRTASAKQQDAHLECALRCQDGQCAVQSSRPIQCRTECPVAVAGSDGAQLDDHARTVGRGVAQGLSAALNEAGLDGQRYELNSALAVVLHTPDAADRWARGEDVFSQCQTFQV